MTNINNDTTIRELERSLVKFKNNKYYGVFEYINVNDLISDCHIYEDLESYSFGEELSGFEFLIISAFGKTYIGIGYSCDTPNLVYKSEDGIVYCAKSNFASPDLDAGNYYTGDEYIEIGREAKYSSKQSWLHDSLDINPSVKSLGISEKTMQRLLDTRESDISKLLN